LWFKKELNILLEKQNIAKSSRGFFIRRQIKGAAATVLTTELKNHSYPSADVIYRILETHYGENYYILGLLAKEHAKIGKIPGNDKDWSSIYGCYRSVLISRTEKAICFGKPTRLFQLIHKGKVGNVEKNIYKFRIN